MPDDTSDSLKNMANLRQKGTDEPIASFLNIRLMELSPGFARVSMKDWLKN